MEEKIHTRAGLGHPRNGLMRNDILEAIQESGNEVQSVYELSWVTGANIFFVLKALKQLCRADLIFVRVNYAVHWCSRRWRNGW